MKKIIDTNNSFFRPSIEKQGPSVLSSKKLSATQRELLLNSGIGLVERDFISVKPVPFEVGQLPDNIIFTSKNAVKALRDHPCFDQLKQKSIFCVGGKTSEFLRERGFQIELTRDYGKDLATEIIRNYARESFLFFSGKIRNPALPDGLKESGIDYKEITVYDTVLTSTKIDRTFDGVLFFSPSAVKSFCSVNDLSRSIAFCIGTTTSKEAEKYTDKVKLARTPSIENVIVQVVKYLGTSGKKI